MIQGLQIELSSDEIRQHLKNRVSYHSDKAEWYEGQIDSLSAGLREQPNISNDPVSSLRRSLSEHQNKAAFFAVLRDHIIPDETYRLSEHDLGRLEFIAVYF